MTRADKAQQQALAAHAAAIRQLLTDPTLEPSHGGGALLSLVLLLNTDPATGQLRPGCALSPALHADLCRFVQTTPYSKNLYLLARGHLKTSIITVAMNVLRILRRPSIRILIASNKAENAEAMLADIKGALMHPWLMAAFPDVLYADPAREAPKWTGQVITVKRPRVSREGTVETIGITGEITSKHYDHMVYDDVVGKENSQTREELLKTIQFIRLTQPLLDPGGTQDYVGTPWHYADAYAWLLEQKDHHGLALGVYRAECWRPVEEMTPGAEWADGFGWRIATYPEKFTVALRDPTKKCLMDERKLMGPGEFAAQMLIDPVSADTVYFPRQQVAVRPRRDLPPLDGCWLVMTVDPAISTKAWADYSAIAAVAFDGAGHMVLPDLRRGRWKEDELVNQCYDMYDALLHGGGRVIAVGFEAISFAKIFRRLFEQAGERRGYYLPVVQLERDTRITKNVRIRALQPWWAAGEITVAAEAQAAGDLLDEAERWRPDRESTHDDLLDAVVDGLQLRAQPAGVEPEPVSLYEDPLILERVAFEQALISERARAGRPTLDRVALQVAWSQHRRKQEFAQAAEALAGTSAVGEWSG